MTTATETAVSRALKRRPRDWRVAFDASADFVFTRTLRMDNPFGRPEVLAGDPLTPEMREGLGEHRVKVWWRAGALEMLEPGEPLPLPVGSPKRKEPRQSRKPRKAARGGAPSGTFAGASVEHRGKGHYLVTLPDGSTRKVRGKAAVSRLLRGPSADDGRAERRSRRKPSG